MNLHSMRAKMTLALALSIALFMAFLTTVYLFESRRAMEKDFAASLDRIAAESRKIPKGSLTDLRSEVDAHNAQVARSGAISEGVEVWLLNSSGKVLWTSGRAPFPHYDHDGDHDGGHDHHPPPSLFPPPGDPPPTFVPPLDLPNDWRSRTLKWGDGKLVLALPWHRARRDLESRAIALGAISIFISAAAAFGAWILVGKTLRPIDALAQQALDAARNPIQLVQQGTPLKSTSSDGEMQHLVSTLNQMLDSVREAAVSKERFHTSASHELRTPLQALGGHLGVTLSRERSQEEYKIALQEAATQTARLSKLTGDLLLLNRLQTTATTPQKENVDVAEICDIALQRAQKLIASRSLKLVENWEALEIEAPPSHLEILLGNLIENAAKYALEGGEIGITISAASRSVLVWNQCQSDQLQNLANELPRLFEPFYRPDSARSSQTGGNGLGLAICQSITEINDWKIETRTAAPHFYVTLYF